jgi:hypothetical protein
MKIFPAIAAACALLGLGVTLLAYQGRVFEDDDEAPALPTDAHEKAEWAFARYHFRSADEFGGYRRFQLWRADYPKADRQFTMGVRRLTRLHTRGIEQVVDADSDELFNWPWIYMEHGNGWNLTEDEALRLRQYLLRGGFLLSDDTHGDYEWEQLVRGLEMILPGRPIEDLQNNDEIFHVMYDLDDRVQIHGTRFLWGGRPYGPDMWFRSGERSVTIKGGSSWRSAITQTWATRGNGPIVLIIRNAKQGSPTGLGSTTSSST